MNDLEKVKFYKKIATNYQLCSVRPELLSDTWGHSLQQKGGTFPLETLDRMLELGNPVNSWIDDFNYVIDSTILDIESLVIQKLLAIGEIQEKIAGLVRYFIQAISYTKFCMQQKLLKRLMQLE